MDIKRAIDVITQADTTILSKKELADVVFPLAKAMSKLSSEMKNRGKSDTQRLGFYPIDESPESIQSYHRAQKLDSGFWLAQEIDYTSDAKDFRELDRNEQEILKKIMAIFAVGDGAIIDSLLYLLVCMSERAEDQMFYISQMHNEQVHAQTYGDMLLSVLKSQKEVDEVMAYPDNIEPLKRVMDFLDSLKDSGSYKSMYASNAMGEYLIFSSLFAVIFWFRAYRPGKMKGVVSANEQIAKDEGMHAIQSCAKYKELDDKFTDGEIHKRMGDLMKILDDFVEELIGGVDMIELSLENFRNYIRFIADDLLEELGHRKMYHTKNPLNFMKLQDLGVKTNFYEADVNSYTRFSTSGKEMEDSEEIY